MLRYEESIAKKRKKDLDKGTKGSKKTSPTTISTPFSKHLPSKSEKTPCHYAKTAETQTDRREPPGNKKKMYTIQKEHSKRVRAKER